MPQPRSRPADRPADRLPVRPVTSEPVEPALARTVLLLDLAMRPFTRRDWRGQEHLPRTGGVVVVVNHISNTDPLAVGQFLAHSGRWPRFLAKASLFTAPVVGRVVRACGQIPVERHTRSAATALDAAVAAVEAGKAVIVYPEGTITADPDLWPMAGRSGAARIALATGCPVVPLGQWGAQELMYGKRRHLPHLLPPKTLRLAAGPPVPLDDLRDQPVSAAVLDEATERIMAAVTALVADLRGSTPPVVRFDPRRPGPTSQARSR